MIKYQFLIPLWNRTALEGICLRNLLRFRDDFGINLGIHCIVSEPEAVSLCESLNIPYTIYENLPVGRKWNEGLWAIRNQEWEYLCIIGSDDIVTDELFFHYSTNAHRVAQFNRALLYDSPRVKFKSIKGYFGAGRIIHRDVIEMLHYTLWDSSISKGLDTSAQKRMAAYDVEVITIPVDKYPLIDIKTKVNITNINNLFGQRVPYDIALDGVPNGTIKEICKLFPNLGNKIKKTKIGNLILNN